MKPASSPANPAALAQKAKRALQVAQAIVSDIQLNAREAGDRLPQEEDMLARYEVARATLREALRFLELQGVIFLQPGRGGGPIVSRPRTRDFASSLSLILQFMDTDLMALLELREAIAPDMAARAAERATNADLAALSDCFAQLERERDTDAFEEVNRRFHDLLGWASGNPTFGLLTSALHLLTRNLADGLGYSAQERENQMRCLMRVLSAVRLKDAGGARRHMERLVRGSSEYLAGRSPELVAQRVKWGDPAWGMRRVNELQPGRTGAAPVSRQLSKLRGRILSRPERTNRRWIWYMAPSTFVSGKRFDRSSPRIATSRPGAADARPARGRTRWLGRSC